MKINYVITMAMVLILLSGCGSANNGQSAGGTDWEPTRHETVNDLEGITMTIKEGTISSTGVTVTIANKSDKRCIYGEHFLLEKKIEESWYQVPVAIKGGYGFDDIGYELAPADVKDWTVDWEWLYGSLDRGEYRIVKEILESKDRGDHDTHPITAEFTVN